MLFLPEPRWRTDRPDMLAWLKTLSSLYIVSIITGVNHFEIGYRSYSALHNMHATCDERSLIPFSVQENQRRTFFSVFYLCINGGSLLSTIITPILRGRYEWNIKFVMNSAISWDSPWEWVKFLVLFWWLHLQLRNVASTVSRNVILWPLVSLQH